MPSAAKQPSSRTTRATGRTTTSTRRPPAKRTSTRRDVIALVKADHSAVNQLFQRYKALGARAVKAKRQIAERVIKELSLHAAAEEQVLYPNAREALPNGSRLVNEAIDEHQSLKEALAELEKCPPEDARFDQLMRTIRDEVKHHVKEEEAAEGILGQLRKHAARDDLVRLGSLFGAAKKAAPTRPHPKAPSTPPGNIILGAAAAVVDKARDKVAGRK
jgi:hemerythrin superfamily protein